MDEPRIFFFIYVYLTKQQSNNLFAIHLTFSKSTSNTADYKVSEQNRIAEIRIAKTRKKFCMGAYYSL